MSITTADMHTVPASADKLTAAARPSTNGSQPASARWDRNTFVEKTRGLTKVLGTYVKGQKTAIRYTVAAKVLGDVILYRGPSGIGKTELAECARKGTLDRPDAQGVTVTCYQGMSRAKLYGSENALTGKETAATIHAGAIQITIDEIGMASEEDMTHFHQIIGRREVVREGMDDFQLHPNSHFILTGNTPDYAANVDPTEALMDRVGVMVPYGYLTEANLAELDQIDPRNDIWTDDLRWTTADIAAAQAFVNRHRRVFDETIRDVANFLVGHTTTCELWDVNGRASVRVAKNIKDYANVGLLMNQKTHLDHKIRAEILVEVVWRTMYHRLRPARSVFSEEMRQQVFWNWLFLALNDGSRHGNKGVARVCKAMSAILNDDEEARAAKARIRQAAAQAAA